MQSSTCCPVDVNLESWVEDNCVEYYVAQNPCQYSVQSSPRLDPVREVPSEVYSSTSDGSRGSLTSEIYSEFEGLSSQEQCQEHSFHPMPPGVSSHPNQGYSGHLPYSSTYLGYPHQYSQQQMPISSSRYPTVVPNTGVLMYQPNVPILQPCPVIIDGSAPVVGRSIPYIPVHPYGNPVVTTPSFEPFKQLRAGLDGHRSAPGDHTGQPPPNVSSGDPIANSTIVSTGNCPIQEMSNCVSVLPTKHFISPDVFISCSQHVTSSYLGIASFIKKEQLNSSFRRRGRRKYRWNFVCPPDDGFVPSACMSI